MAVTIAHSLASLNTKDSARRDQKGIAACRMMAAAARYGGAGLHCGGHAKLIGQFRELSSDRGELTAHDGGRRVVG
jgi:hypothetical protein